MIKLPGAIRPSRKGNTIVSTNQTRSALSRRLEAAPVFRTLFALGVAAALYRGFVLAPPVAEMPLTGHCIARPGQIVTVEIPTSYSAPHGYHEISQRVLKYSVQTKTGWAPVEATPNKTDESGSGVNAPYAQGKPFGSEIDNSTFVEKLFGSDRIDARIALRIPDVATLCGCEARVEIDAALVYPEKEWSRFRRVPGTCRQTLTFHVATEAEAELYGAYLVKRSLLGWGGLLAMLLAMAGGFWRLAR